MQRRRFTLALAAAPAAGLALPVLASTRRVVAPVSEGPFYPSADWRERTGLEGDADLTRQGGRVARGEHLGLELVLADTAGRAVDGALVEIWQCDAMAAYRHPRVALAEGSFDPGFQGIGAARSGADGVLRLRTIRPVAYPGRTPHIHIKLRHASFGEVTSQLFVAGEAANARDFLWRALGADDRTALEMALQRAPAGSDLAWTSRHALTLPA